jgi:hypothetical protein
VSRNYDTAPDVQSHSDAIGRARAKAQQSLAAARRPGDEIDAVTDLLRALHALMDLDRDAVRAGRMSSTTWHSRYQDRPCGHRGGRCRICG